MQTLASIDLADPVLHAENDLAPVWDYLRSECPLYWQPAKEERPGFWALTRHEDVVSAYRDARRFSSDRGNTLDTLLQGGDPAAGLMLPTTNGRRHAELRAELMRAFSPRALAGTVASLRAAARELVEEALAEETFDFAEDVAGQLPLRAICDLLDVPPADRRRLLDMTSSALGSGSKDGLLRDNWVAKGEILLYFSELAARRRRDPQDDIVSLLTQCRVSGEPLSDEEVVLNCYSLILGGDETTRLSLIGGVAALLDHPDQWRAYQEGHVDTESAVEEVLRWTTPAAHAGRVAGDDIALHGRTIKAGDIVTLWNASANRDPRVFDDPGELRLSRKPNRHVTFSFGAHFCLGSYLARAEIGAVLDNMRERVGSMTAAGRARHLYSNFLNGFDSLPLSWERSAS
ncbi:cytochrome P450 [Actinomadura bangladeshensis]|uniref:Cytochrome P450 n=2 Tax=Actinomadura bangladeshensis TaxID=453573 RepID=A0A6L9QHN0_9ACTN|nr:cytochrome P450 [Actinomadura bangladeshensis]